MLEDEAPLSTLSLNTDNKKIIKANQKEINNFSIIAQQEQQVAFEKNVLHNKHIAIKNEVFQSHQRTITLLFSHNLFVWKEQNNKLFCRLKLFAEKQKGTKEEIGDIIFNITGCHVNLYNYADDVLVANDYCLIISLLPIVRKDVFNPWNGNEFTSIANNLYDRNTFEYTELLQKRLVPSRINQLEQEINNLRAQLHYSQTYYQQILNQIINKEDELQWCRDSIIVEEESIIEELLKLIFCNVNEFDFFIFWLSNFFWTLNKSNIAVVLIGDSETTDILVDYIIKPIFARNTKYISTITSDLLSKESDNDKLLADKILYHVNNLGSKTDVKRVSKLLRNIVKPNYITPAQAWDSDEPYIYGELLVTSEKENPYSYLKNIFSSCTVLRVKNMDSILSNLNMDYSQLERSIASDLNNFVNKLVHHSQYNSFLTVLNTDEKSYLHTMKNGVLITPIIDKKIDDFVENIVSKNTSVFELIKEHEEETYKELMSNFDEGMITQPSLSTYFNIINSDILIPDNNEFIKILQTKADMFKEVPNDKSKINGKKRYKIFR